MTGMSSLSLRAGKQFIYLIPYDSGLNRFYLSAALKSSMSCEHMPAQHSLPDLSWMAKRSWLI